MVAPVAKGIIVATTLLLAAGLAAYENEQIRAWIETQRRKIAVALSGGYGPGGSTELDEKDREREANDLAVELRDEVIRRHREEIFERARKEGVAVDWDELAAVEQIYEEQARKAVDASSEKGTTRRGSAQTFDELVGSDGMLKDRDITVASASGVAGSSSQAGIRQRGLFGFGRGAAFANPFDDEAQFVFDQELIGAGGEELAAISRTGNTSRTISAEPDLASLVDVHESPYKSDEELADEIEEAIRRSLEDVVPPTTKDGAQPLIHLNDDDDDDHASGLDLSQISYNPLPLQSSIYESYYYGGRPDTPTGARFFSASASPAPPSTSTLHIPSPATLTDEHHRGEEAQLDSDDALTPAGTLTPTTEAGFSSIDGDSADEMADSLYGEPSAVYQSFDIGDLLGARLRDQQRERQQQQEQQRGGAEQGDEESSDGFSVVDESHTPGSWTDVESVGGYDEEDIPSEPLRGSSEGTVGR